MTAGSILAGNRKPARNYREKAPVCALRASDGESQVLASCWCLQNVACTSQNPITQWPSLTMTAGSILPHIFSRLRIKVTLWSCVEGDP